MSLFEVKQVDRAFYQENIEDFLPREIVDIHTHVWQRRRVPVERDSRSALAVWPSLVASQNPIEDLMDTYRLLFPGKEVTPLIFSAVDSGDDIDALNRYVSDCARSRGVPSLIFAAPWWEPRELERNIQAGGFVGCKVYLSLAPDYIPPDEIRIFDYLPHHHLEVLDKNGWIVMLHIPRPTRLRDRVNLAQMLEIEERYSNIKLIIAHVGRAYCDEDVGDAFEYLKPTKNMLFDFSANTNQWVFERLIETVGPKRILFGSDLPILRMRTRRICENGMYINLVPKGMYGDVSVDKHMREVDGAEAEALTFFLYEEIDAFRRAAVNLTLSKTDIEDVFRSNALRVLER